LAGTGAAVIGFAAWRRVEAQAVREINMVAQRFEFVPNAIELKVGEPVLLRIRSLDYIHGFNVPDLGIRADLLPGLVTPIRLTPTQVGRLDFLCDNFCGDSHEEMHGQFNVLA
jgi:cytochrome c oxidase subunit 2